MLPLYRNALVESFIIYSNLTKSLLGVHSFLMCFTHTLSFVLFLFSTWSLTSEDLFSLYLWRTKTENSRKVNLHLVSLQYLSCPIQSCPLSHVLLQISISSRNIVVNVATDVGVYCSITSIVCESSVSWTLARDLRRGAPRLTLGRCISLMVGLACLRVWQTIKIYN